MKIEAMKKSIESICDDANIVKRIHKTPAYYIFFLIAVAPLLILLIIDCVLIINGKGEYIYWPSLLTIVFTVFYFLGLFYYWFNPYIKRKLKEYEIQTPPKRFDHWGDGNHYRNYKLNATYQSLVINGYLHGHISDHVLLKEYKDDFDQKAEKYKWSMSSLTSGLIGGTVVAFMGIAVQWLPDQEKSLWGLLIVYSIICICTIFWMSYPNVHDFMNKKSKRYQNLANLLNEIYLSLKRQEIDNKLDK